MLEQTASSRGNGLGLVLERAPHHRKRYAQSRSTTPFDGTRCAIERESASIGGSRRNVQALSQRVLEQRLAIDRSRTDSSTTVRGTEGSRCASGRSSRSGNRRSGPFGRKRSPHGAKRGRSSEEWRSASTVSELPGGAPRKRARAASSALPSRGTSRIPWLPAAFCAPAVSLTHA